jgi:hypothetical protein
VGGAWAVLDTFSIAPEFTYVERVSYIATTIHLARRALCACYRPRRIEFES